MHGPLRRHQRRHSPLDHLQAGNFVQLLAATRKVQAEAAALRAQQNKSRPGSSGGGPAEPSQLSPQKRGVDVPKQYLCPISQELMDDPVTTADGHTYERREIFRWLCTHNTSPLTGATLPNKFLTPAIALRQLIANFKSEHPEVDSLIL